MKSKMTKVFGIMVSLVITLAMLLILPAQLAMAVPAPGKVDLVLLPATLTVNPGDNFVVTVQAQCGTQTTNGIEAHLDFDPNYLAVQSITQGTTLVTVLQPATWDNTVGKIDFSAGQLSTQPAYPSGNFNVLAITFKAKSVLTVTSTAVSFHTSDTRITNVILDANIITGTLTGATYTINDITPPTVQAVTPSNNTTGVAVSSAVAVTFSEAMNHSATEGAFSLKQGATAVAGAFSWNPASTMLTFTPAPSLAYNTNYVVGISTAATDTASPGNHLAVAFTSTFTTQNTPPAPPAVATLAATAITNNTVTLSGNLTSLGTATPVNVSFEYGYTTAYGKTTAAQSMVSTGAFNAAVTGLFPGMVWHYRAVAVGTTTVYGNDMTFTTTSTNAPYFTAKFAFISARNGNEEVYAITPDGVYSARLTDNAFKEAWPRFSPDFTKVTFTSWRDGNGEVYVMNPDGTSQTRITNNAAFDGMSDFAWNGSKIAFISDRDGNYEIYVMNADGTGQTRLTNNAVTDTYPSWLNDGTKISFSSIRDGNSQIYAMNANGTNLVRLTNNTLTDDQPLWCPTGMAIVFTRWLAGNIPQVMFMWPDGTNQAQFTGNPEGNWSRANWTIPSIQTYSVNASVTGGHGTVNPASQTVNAGVNATINITPDSGYHIASITDNGTAVTIANPYIISNVSANHTVVVTFSDKYTITASAGANGSVTPLGAVAVNPGASQSFTITPNTGYRISTLTVDGAAVIPAVGSYNFTNVTANHTISATFAANTTVTYTITASAGANGSIAPSGAVTVNSGDNQSFTMTPATGYHVASVLVDGVSVGAAGSYNFNNVIANHTIVASFAINDSSVQILKSVTQGTDDGYSTSSSGDFSNNITWYEAGSPADKATNNAWFRFTGITIPANAIIDEAYLEIIQSKWNTGTSLKIFAEAAANPSAPTSANDHSSRVRTASGVAWTNGYSDTTTWHTSPNFASVIRELVSRHSYNNGVIQILVDDAGSAAGAGAAGYTFENAGFAPRLYIRYHVAPSVTTSAATSIATSTATLNGNLTSLGNASSANVSFEYGTTTSYGKTVTGTPSSLTNIGTFTANLTGLTAGTTYFYRAKAVGTGTVYGAQATFTTLALQTSGGGGDNSGGGGGGGGGDGGYSSVTVLSLSGMSGPSTVLNTQGEVTSSSVLTSTDAQVKILIPAGTKMLAGNGSALNTITCVKTASPPEPPAGNIIVVGYDFGPNGATFNPPITLTLRFNTADLPAGTLLSNLQLAFWDGTKWQILSNSQVDAATGQISAKVSHFTNFAVLAVVPPKTPAPVPTTPTVTPAPVPAPAAPVPAATPVVTPVAEPAPVPAVAPTVTQPAPVNTTPEPITPPAPAPETKPAFSATWLLLVGGVVVLGLALVIIAKRRQD